MKTKKLQYHSLVDKVRGQEFYEKFLSILKEELAANSKEKDKMGTVKNGTYGNRQGLKFDSPGPFTHSFEF